MKEIVNQGIIVIFSVLTTCILERDNIDTIEVQHNSSDKVDMLYYVMVIIITGKLSKGQYK